MSEDFSRLRPIATWSPARGAWETEAVSLLCGHSALYSATWPASGSMRNGAAFARRRSGLPTAESGYSSSLGPLLKTPTTNLGSNGGSQHPDKRRAGGHGPTLADEVEHLLPTPSASGHDDGKAPEVWRARRERMRAQHGVGIGTPPLPVLVALLPTPRASHHEEGPEAAEQWLRRRAKPRRSGAAADTSLPLGLAVQCRPELARYAIGASMAEPSSDGHDSPAPLPGQLTIEVD